jgi:hypothetical protein
MIVIFAATDDHDDSAKAPGSEVRRLMSIVNVLPLTRSMIQ